MLHTPLMAASTAPLLLPSTHRLNQHSYTVKYITAKPIIPNNAVTSALISPLHTFPPKQKILDETLAEQHWLSSSLVGYPAFQHHNNCVFVSLPRSNSQIAYIRSYYVHSYYTFTYLSIQPPALCKGVPSLPSISLHSLYDRNTEAGPHRNGTQSVKLCAYVP